MSAVNHGEPTGIGRRLRPRGGNSYIRATSNQTGSSTVIHLGTTERHFWADHRLIADQFLEETGADTLPHWLNLVAYQDDGTEKSHARDMAKEDLRQPRYWRRKASDWLRDLVLENLNYDLLLGSYASATISADGYFRPLLARKTAMPDPAPGHLAIRVLVPRLTDLSWPQIAEIRDMNAIISFRQAILEIESQAREMVTGGGDIRDAIHLQAEIDLAKGWRPPSRLQTAGKAVIYILLGLLPIPNLASVALNVAADDRRHRTWGAMFLKLREYTK